MKRELIMLVCAAAASAALAITATKEYVDRRDAGISEAATNYTDAAIAPIAIHTASNEVAIANVETKATDAIDEALHAREEAQRAQAVADSAAYTAYNATITNAMQDIDIASHASQLSQMSQSLDGKVPTSRTVNSKALTSDISLSADDVGAWPAVEGSEWGMGSTGLTLYLGPGYLSGTYCFGIDSEWHVMRRRDVEDATNATLAAAMTYTDNHAPDIGSAISNTVPAWARAASKPTYTAAEVGAYSEGDVDTILRDYLPLDYFRDGQTIPIYYGDGTKLCDFGAYWLSGLVDTVNEKPDADDIPPAVSNIVTTALVRERLGVWMEYDEATGFYYYCHEEE